jgi:formamidopyrimidine-DNA glycosylase
VVRDLRPRLVGRRIAGVRVSRLPLRTRWSAKWGAGLAGRRVRAVQRRGKWILVSLDYGTHLLIHLGMTGQLRVVPARQPVARHTHVVFDLDRGREQLRFRDIRRFGSATVLAGAQLVDRFFEEARLGPEPFDLDTRYWRQCLARTRRCLKAILLDQRVVAGVGNIYADEALFEARLHPARLGQELVPREVKRLHRAVPVVLNRAIERRGSSIRDYVDGSGQRGGYQEEFRVYGRTGRPCPRCARPIERIRLAGRSTHYCPHCQSSAETVLARGERHIAPLGK